MFSRLLGDPAQADPWADTLWHDAAGDDDPWDGDRHLQPADTGSGAGSEDPRAGDTDRDDQSIGPDDGSEDGAAADENAGPVDDADTHSDTDPDLGSREH